MDEKHDHIIGNVPNEQIQVMENDERRKAKRTSELRKHFRSAISTTLLLTVMVTTRVANHQLRTAAGTRPLLQDTLKALDFMDFSQQARNPIFPPNYYQWHMDNRGKVPYPYKGWDKK